MEILQSDDFVTQVKKFASLTNKLKIPQTLMEIFPPIRALLQDIYKYPVTKEEKRELLSLQSAQHLPYLGDMLENSSDIYGFTVIGAPSPLIIFKSMDHDSRRGDTSTLGLFETIAHQVESGLSVILLSSILEDVRKAVPGIQSHVLGHELTHYLVYTNEDKELVQFEFELREMGGPYQWIPEIFADFTALSVAMQLGDRAQAEKNFLEYLPISPIEHRVVANRVFSWMEQIVASSQQC